MQLHIEAPAGWSISTAAPGIRVGQHPDGMVMAIGPITPLPEDQHGWRDAAIRSQLPPGARAEVIASADTTTSLGWPIRVVDVAVHQGERLLERRLLGFFHLLEFGCVVVARGPDAAMTTARDALVAAFAAAWPRWSSGEIASLHELWL
jgi:hypothetical protein